MDVRPAHHERPVPSICGEPPHHDDVLAYRPVLAAQDVHIEVDVEGEASVEPDLLPAGELAGCERAKVSAKPRSSGFFHLKTRSPTINTSALCVSTSWSGSLTAGRARSMR